MRRGMKFGLSAIEKGEVWNRWKAGQSLHEIGRAFGKEHSCIRSVLLPHGGIRPAARRRSPLALTLAEREDISRGIASDSSIREIARRMNRAASTVSREVIRHGGRPAYRAHDADRQAWTLALRPKRCLLARNRKLRNIVASKLILDLTGPSFCTSSSERVYITAMGCEIEFGGARELQAAGAGGL